MELGKEDACEGGREQDVVVVEREEKEGQGLEVYGYQVSGKTPKYIDNIHGNIYKLFSESQYSFYEFINKLSPNDPKAQLKQYIPQYIGLFKEQELQGMSTLKKQQQNKQQIKFQPNSKSHRNFWIDHISSRNKQTSSQTYLCLKNLTYNYQHPNILDIKLGRKKPKKSNIKFQNSTTNSHEFRINGMVVHLRNQEYFQQCFLSKYFGQKITVDEIEKYLALFFFNGKNINLQLLMNIVKELDNLIDVFKKFTGVKFISSSLFIGYDGGHPQNFTLKLIDFDKYEHDEIVVEDTNISQGLENVCLYFKSIVKLREVHEKVLIDKKLDIFGKDVLIVPESKISQFKFKKAEEEENI